MVLCGSASTTIFIFFFAAPLAFWRPALDNSSMIMTFRIAPGRLVSAPMGAPRAGRWGQWAPRVAGGAWAHAPMGALAAGQRVVVMWYGENVIIYA